MAVTWIWDISHYDSDRGPVNLARAVGEGIQCVTHKVSEGRSYTDPRAGAVLARARAAGVPLLGGYHVLRRGAPVDQAAFFISRASAVAPWWTEHPGWFWQLDCESWQDGTIPAPTLADIHAAADHLVARTGRRVIVYAPAWVYGQSLRGLRYPLWASRYVDGAKPFQQLYPGDGWKGWAPYSGITPTILQYSSSAVIAGQPQCDANAYRGTLAGLAEVLAPDLIGDDMLRDEQLLSAKISALQALDDVASSLRLGHSGIGGPGDKHWINRTLEQILAKVDALAGPTFTDDQVDALAGRIAEALVEREDTPLGPDDVPAIVAGVQQALRAGTGP